MSRLWKRYLRLAAAVAGVMGATMLTAMYFVLLPPFAWMGQTRGPPRARRLDACRVPPPRILDEPVSDMKILGISAHYHRFRGGARRRRPAGGRRAEERLSRRKTTARFPWRDRMVPRGGGIDAADLDAVVFYERSMLKFERILTCALRAFPRSWRSFRRHQELARRKVWVRGIVASYLGVPRRKILLRITTDPTPRPLFSRRRRGARRFSRRRRRRMGDVDGRPRRTACREPTDITCCAR